MRSDNGGDDDKENNKKGGPYQKFQDATSETFQVPVFHASAGTAVVFRRHFRTAPETLECVLVFVLAHGPCSLQLSFLSRPHNLR